MRRKLLLAFALGIVATFAATFGVGCNKPNSADNTPETPKHNYGEWVIDREASCIESGRKYHVCQDEGCNNMEWEVIPKTAHKNDIINRTNAGHSFTCSVCKTTTDIEAHNFKNGICTGCGADENGEYENDETLNFTFALYGDSYKVTGAIDNKATVHIIPSKYKGKPVTEIADRAFYEPNGNRILQKVIIPDSIKKIGDSAFEKCVRLTDIQLTNSVEYIGRRAFFTSTNDYEWSIPTISFIGLPEQWNAVEKSLQWIWTYNNSSPRVLCYDKIEDLGLTICFKDIANPEISVVEFDNSILELVIPKSYKNYEITSIDEKAFSGCTKLTSIIIPNSVTSIGYGAFDGCTSLENVTFKNTTGWRVTTIDVLEEAFLTEEELSDAAQAANYLADKYCHYRWYNINNSENNN